VLIKQAEMGAGLQELQAYGDLNEDRSIEYQTRLSAVEDLDYAKATAELARQQIGYQAALQSYSMVSKMSLFDFL
jgi:flagellar hook-associated protein 3 FlgL